jgi:hypothetical protein
MAKYAPLFKNHYWRNFRYLSLGMHPSSLRPSKAANGASNAPAQPYKEGSVVASRCSRSKGPSTNGCSDYQKRAISLPPKKNLQAHYGSHSLPVMAHILTLLGLQGIIVV